MTTPAELVAAATDESAGPDEVRAALTAMLDHAAYLLPATVFDILAREPRIKPTRSLVIDPGDSVRRRWSVRVAAAATLLAAPSVVEVFAELADELAESPDLAAEVLDCARPHAGLSLEQRAVLSRLADRYAGRPQPGSAGGC